MKPQIKEVFEALRQDPTRIFLFSNGCYFRNRKTEIKEGGLVITEKPLDGPSTPAYEDAIVFQCSAGKLFLMTENASPVYSGPVYFSDLPDIKTTFMKLQECVEDQFTYNLSL